MRGKMEYPKELDQYGGNLLFLTHDENSEHSLAGHISGVVLPVGCPADTPFFSGAYFINCESLLVSCFLLGGKEYMGQIHHFWDGLGAAFVR